MKKICLAIVASVLLYIVGIIIYDEITVKDYDGIFLSKGYMGSDIYVRVKDCEESKEENAEKAFVVNCNYSDIIIGKRAIISVKGARIPFTQKYPRIVRIEYSY